jgi:hypothetical protein
VGDIVMDGDLDELTVGIGTITHTHLIPYSSSMSAPERRVWLSEAIVDLLDALFDDRILLWRVPGGGGGGFRRFESAQEASVDEINEWFLWSGPLERAEEPAG